MERIIEGLAQPMESVNGLIQRCTSPFELYMGRINWNLDLVKVGGGIRVLIPRNYLYGTQRRDEYSKHKRGIVEYRLAKCGVDCLKRHPVVACGLPTHNGLALAIVDGHHRARYSGRFHINRIPTICLTTDQLAIILNHAGVQPSINGSSLVERLSADLVEALHSFDLPQIKQSQPIPVTNVEDLANHFIFV